MKKVAIWTDGSCEPNPGLGGWGAVLKYSEHIKELSGAVEDTTNNRMELFAAIQALEALKFPCYVDLTSDSQYLVKTMTGAYRQSSNQDLWEILNRHNRVHIVQWHWVRGHALDTMNNHCDKLAGDARRAFLFRA